MEILLNGEKETLDGDHTVKELIEKFEMNPDVVSVSLNGNIIQRKEFDHTLVKNGDTVDVLMFMGGGR